MNTLNDWLKSKGITDPARQQACIEWLAALPVAQGMVVHRHFKVGWWIYARPTLNPLTGSGFVGLHLEIHHGLQDVNAYYTTPGGNLEVAEQAVRREIVEELDRMIRTNLLDAQRLSEAAIQPVLYPNRGQQ